MWPLAAAVSSARSYWTTRPSLNSDFLIQVKIIIESYDYTFFQIRLRSAVCGGGTDRCSLTPGPLRAAEAPPLSKQFPLSDKICATSVTCTPHESNT